MRRRYVLGLLALGLGGTGYWASTDRPVPAPNQAPQPTDRPTTDTVTPTPAATPTATPTPVPDYSERKEYGGKAVTVSSPESYRELVTDEETVAAAEGELFLFVKLTGENTGDQLMNPPWPFEMRWDGGKVEALKSLDGAGSTLETPDRGLYTNGPVLGGGGALEGWVYAPVPADLRELTFVWYFETEVRTESSREITYTVPVPAPE